MERMINLSEQSRCLKLFSFTYQLASKLVALHCHYFHLLTEGLARRAIQSHPGTHVVMVAVTMEQGE